MMGWKKGWGAEVGSVMFPSMAAIISSATNYSTKGYVETPIPLLIQPDPGTFLPFLPSFPSSLPAILPPILPIHPSSQPASEFLEVGSRHLFQDKACKF